MKLSHRLARVSAYTHTEDHLRVKTIHGGIVTILGATLAIVLFFSEANRCLRLRLDQQMSVDTNLRPTMHVAFNLTFPALPCEAVRMDMGDVGGRFETESMAAAAHDGEVHKWRLDAAGRHIDRHEYIAPRGQDNPFVLNLNMADMTSLREAVQRHEGCNLYGWLEVQRVAGNIHFAVKPEAAMAVAGDNSLINLLFARHIQLNGNQKDADAHLLNASHVIHTLRFGPHYPGQQHPLEGVARVDRKATGLDKYFIKVVPTEWKGPWGRTISTYQYSVTEYYSRLAPESQSLPGVYFLYDSWPIQVNLRAHRLGLLHLGVRVCAVVGGVWAVTSATDRCVHSAVTASRRLLKSGAAP